MHRLLKTGRKWFGGAVVVGMLISCASYTDETQEMMLAYREFRFDSALDELAKSGVDDDGKNRLLYHLEKAMILDRLGRRIESQKLLMKADGIVDQLFTKSVTKEAATYVYNEGAQAYPGEDYEKVAIHTMLAHSFLEDGDLQSARVEAARINTRLSEINSFYQENKNRYREDAYARYLAGIIYEALGEYDSSIIDYKNAIKVYETDYVKYFDTPEPRQAVEALYGLYLKRGRRDEAKKLSDKYSFLQKKVTTEPMGEIVIIHELGLISRKESTEFIYPIGDQIVRFSFPVIKKKSTVFGWTGLKLADGSKGEAERSQNFDAIASETLEDSRVRLLAKSAARLIFKGQLTQKANKEFGPLGFVAASIYGAVTETADTRSWTLLPAAISVSRMKVKPGNYDLVVFTNGKASSLKKITVKKDQVFISRDY